MNMENNGGYSSSTLERGVENKKNNGKFELDELDLAGVVCVESSSNLFDEDTGRRRAASSEEQLVVNIVQHPTEGQGQFSVGRNNQYVTGRRGREQRTDDEGLNYNYLNCNWSSDDHLFHQQKLVPNPNPNPNRGFSNYSNSRCRCRSSNSNYGSNPNSHPTGLLYPPNYPNIANNVNIPCTNYSQLYNYTNYYDDDDNNNNGNINIIKEGGRGRGRGRGAPSPSTITKEIRRDMLYKEIKDQQDSQAFIKRIQSKRMRHGEIDDIISLMASCPWSLCSASCHQQGSYTIKEVIQMVKNRAVISFLTDALSLNVYFLMTHPIGSEVIVHCFTFLDNAPNAVLSLAILKRCLDLARDPQGCITLNKCIYNMEAYYLNIVLHIFTNHAQMLATDPYGTFVLQKIVDLKVPEFAKKVAKNLQGLYIELSVQKAGSYLVEKCLYAFDGAAFVVGDLLNNYSCNFNSNSNSNAHNRLRDLACNEYANYVIQKALCVTKMNNMPLYEKLSSALFMIQQDLKVHPRGRNVYKKLHQTRTPKSR